MTAYCVDTSGSTSTDQALAAVAWIRGRIQPGDHVIVFSSGAEVTDLDTITRAYSFENVADWEGYGKPGHAWFGGTDVKELVRLLKSLNQESAYVVTDGCFYQEDLTVGKMVDITRLPEVHEPRRA